MLQNIIFGFGSPINNVYRYQIQGQSKFLTDYFYASPLPAFNDQTVFAIIKVTAKLLQ